MTAAVPFSAAPRRPGGAPGDAARPPRELMTLPGMHREVRRWRLVEVRLDGRWQPAMLTTWRRPPGSTRWVVHVRWGPDGPGPGEEPWAWLIYDEATIRPLPEPGDNAGLRDAVLVPSEMAGAPDPEDAGRCWRLAWLHLGGWRSALVTEQRKPAPDLPWIASVRWGEDKDAAWVVADGHTLRAAAPAPALEDAAPGAGEPVR